MNNENDPNTAVLHKLQSIATGMQLAAENQAEATRSRSRALLWLAGAIALATLTQAVFAYLNYDLAREAHRRQAFITLPVSTSGH
jgi:hypothetical protein